MKVRQGVRVRQMPLPGTLRKGREDAKDKGTGGADKWPGPSLQHCADRLLERARKLNPACRRQGQTLTATAQVANPWAALAYAAPRVGDKGETPGLTHQHRLARARLTEHDQPPPGGHPVTNVLRPAAGQACIRCRRLASEWSGWFPEGVS